MDPIYFFSSQTQKVILVQGSMNLEVQESEFLFQSAQIHIGLGQKVCWEEENQNVEILRFHSKPASAKCSGFLSVVKHRLCGRV